MSEEEIMKQEEEIEILIEEIGESFAVFEEMVS